MSTGTWHVRLRDIPRGVCRSQDGTGPDGEASHALEVLRLCLKVTESQGRIPRRGAESSRKGPVYCLHKKEARWGQSAAGTKMGVSGRGAARGAGTPCGRGTRAGFWEVLKPKDTERGAPQGRAMACARGQQSQGLLEPAQRLEGGAPGLR